MLKLEKIRWKNFLSFGNIPCEFEFNSNTTVVFGSNGSGKSILADLITFALYGKSYRIIPKPLLINSINKKDLFVEIEFTSYNHKFLVKRGLKPNIFEYYKDGLLVEQDARIKDYQKQFEEEALKISYEIFTQLVIVGKSNYVQFMKLPLGSRRLLIEQLLDLNIFTSMKNILSTKQLTIQKEIKEFQSEQRKLEHSRDVVQTLLHEEIEKTKTSMSSFQDDITANLVRIKELEGLNETLFNKNKNLLSNLKNKEELQEQKDKLDKLITQLKTKHHLTSKDIDFYQKNDSCPSCSQSITHIRELKVPQLKLKETELFDAIGKVARKSKESAISINQNNKLLEIVENNELTINTNSVKIREIEKTVAQLTEKLKHAQISDQDRIDKLNSQLLNLELSIKAVEDQILQLEAKLRNYNKIEPLLKDSGLKSIIIKKYVPIFNKLINHYLSRLGLYVRFELDEEFNERILNRNYDNFVYNSFSEGQRQRIDLAILLTWRDITKLKNSIDCNIMIFDETLDSSLDQSGVDSFIEISHGMKDLNVIVITHTPHKLSSFNRKIEYKMIGNFSTMKESPND